MPLFATTLRKLEANTLLQIQGIRERFIFKHFTHSSPNKLLLRTSKPTKSLTVPQDTPINCRNENENRTENFDEHDMIN